MVASMLARYPAEDKAFLQLWEATRDLTRPACA
jgi:hypothetical protein